MTLITFHSPFVLAVNKKNWVGYTHTHTHTHTRHTHTTHTHSHVLYLCTSTLTFHYCRRTAPCKRRTNVLETGPRNGRSKGGLCMHEYIFLNMYCGSRYRGYAICELCHFSGCIIWTLFVLCVTMFRMSGHSKGLVLCTTLIVWS